MLNLHRYASKSLLVDFSETNINVIILSKNLLTNEKNILLVLIKPQVVLWLMRADLFVYLRFMYLHILNSSNGK